ncbi:hypothetical protein CBL_00836 [Carabus blaptoides fortunei]
MSNGQSRFEFLRKVLPATRQTSKDTIPATVNVSHNQSVLECSKRESQSTGSDYEHLVDKWMKVFHGRKYAIYSGEGKENEKAYTRCGTASALTKSSSYASCRWHKQTVTVANHQHMTLHGVPALKPTYHVCHSNNHTP